MNIKLSLFIIVLVLMSCNNKESDQDITREVIGNHLIGAEPIQYLKELEKIKIEKSFVTSGIWHFNDETKLLEAFKFHPSKVNYFKVAKKEEGFFIGFYFKTGNDSICELFFHRIINKSFIPVHNLSNEIFELDTSYSISLYFPSGVLKLNNGALYGVNDLKLSGIFKRIID